MNVSLISIGLVFLSSFLFYQFITPKWTDIQADLDILRSAQSATSESAAIISKRNELEAHRQQIGSSVTEIIPRVLPELDLTAVPEALVTFNEFLDAEGIVAETLSFSQVDDGDDGLSSITINFSFTREYPTVKRFLEALHLWDRASVIDTIRISKGSESNTRLTAEVDLRVYFTQQGGGSTADNKLNRI